MDNITPVELPPFPLDLRVSLAEVTSVDAVCDEIEAYARAAVLADRARMASAGAVPEGFWLAPMMLDVTMLHAMGDTPGMKAIDSAVRIHQARGYPCNPKAFEGGAPLAQAWVAGRDSWLSRHTTHPAAQVGTSGARRIEDAYREGFRDATTFTDADTAWKLSVSLHLGTSGASAEVERFSTLRDWEIACDDCAGTGKVDHSEPLHVDGRYMGDDLFRIPCNTCLSTGVLVCLADIPKEIQR